MVANCHNLKYTDLAINSSCVQCTQGCTDDNHWIEVLELKGAEVFSSTSKMIYLPLTATDNETIVKCESY